MFLPPFLMLVPMTIVTSSILSVLMLKKMVRLMEILAYTGAPRLHGATACPTIERSELEGRIRARSVRPVRHPGALRDDDPVAQRLSRPDRQPEIV